MDFAWVPHFNPNICKKFPKNVSPSLTDLLTVLIRQFATSCTISLHLEITGLKKNYVWLSGHLLVLISFDYVFVNHVVPEAESEIQMFQSFSYI